MWSLPDITKLNAAAAEGAEAYLEAARTKKLNGEPLACEHAESNGEKCGGELYVYPWYDIFSDDPKGVFGICESHDGYYGDPDEGYFHCGECSRVMVENYTWEYYFKIVNDEKVCLPCAAKLYLKESRNWLKLTKKNIDALTFDDIRTAPHLIGVKMPVPAGIEFVDNAEFDSMDGHGISGGGLNGIKETLHNQRKEGRKRAILILDAAYQFAVSIGVYVGAEEKAEEVA